MHTHARTHAQTHAYSKTPPTIISYFGNIMNNRFFDIELFYFSTLKVEVYRQGTRGVTQTRIITEW